MSWNTTISVLASVQQQSAHLFSRQRVDEGQPSSGLGDRLMQTLRLPALAPGRCRLDPGPHSFLLFISMDSGSAFHQARRSCYRTTAEHLPSETPLLATSSLLPSRRTPPLARPSPFITAKAVLEIARACAAVLGRTTGTSRDPASPLSPATLSPLCQAVTSVRIPPSPARRAILAPHPPTAIQHRHVAVSSKLLL